MFKLNFIAIALLIFQCCMAAHEHSEVAYQYAWSEKHNGTEEYRNEDNTRVDCLTNTHSVEFDFANKWAESIGQVLHYQLFANPLKTLFL